MKRWVGVVVAFLLILPGAAAYAAPPATINIHGSLTASDNSPLTGDRAYSVTFYDASTGGNALGGALTGTVTLTDKGLFNIAITPPEAIFSATQVWYELAIDSDGGGLDANDVFASRTQVQSVPFAKQAGNVGLPENGTAHIVVQTTDNAVTNAANLLAAYAAAKLLTPNGAVLSAANRAMVIVPPGNYDLGSDSLALDAEFVDLIGLTTARGSQYLYSAGNVLVQTAFDVRIENLQFHHTGGDTGTFAYFPAAICYQDESLTLYGSPQQTLIRNCEFRASAACMRSGILFEGTYEDCACGSHAFSCGQYASYGTFTNCTGGDYSFGASGTFTNCTGGNYSFGYGNELIDDATFTNCTGGNYSFGYGNGLIGEATFINCIGGNYSFGYLRNINSSATFINCTGGDYSFGSGDSTLYINGMFRNCVGGDFSFCREGSSSVGRFHYCVGGPGSFPVGVSAQYLYCARNGAAYP